MELFGPIQQPYGQTNSPQPHAGLMVRQSTWYVCIIRICEVQSANHIRCSALN